MNPTQALANRTARLAREAQTPVYSTTTPSAAEARMALLARAEQSLCTEDFCFVCNRCTEHFGEHTDEQILTAWKKRTWMH